MSLELQQLLESENIISALEDSLGRQAIEDIAGTVVAGFTVDEQSISGYVEEMQKLEKVALQYAEAKNYPWEGCSNFKHPLLTVATQQFGARAYPSLVPGVEVVKYKATALHPDTPVISDRGRRVAKHMDYQLLEEMDGWEEDMDAILSTHLPGVGTAFKKTYYDVSKGHNVSEFIPYNELVVNYDAPSLERAYRKTHKLWFTKNELVERFRAGIYREIDLGDPSTRPNYGTREEVSKQVRTGNEGADLPHLVLECHTWYDLDGDGYEEPWICVVHYDTKQLLAVYARFDTSSFVMEGDRLLRIKPVEYFTGYIFLPNPHSKIYGLGFYRLLGSLVDTMNSITNLLIDSGHLHSLNAGFISKNFKIKAGVTSFKPGQFQAVPMLGQDIGKGIFTLPTKEPSSVLFSLLGFLEQNANNVASIKDILLGENPGQNTKVGTVNAMIDQGLKTYTAIFKRVHRSFKRELAKIYRLNKIFLDEEKYFTILGLDKTEKIGKVDYDDSIAVIPVSDPNLATDSQRIQKAGALMPFVELGTVNPQEATRRLLEAQQQEDVPGLMTMPEAGPDFDQQIELQKLELQNKKLEQDFLLRKEELQVRILEALSRTEHQERESSIRAAASIADEILRKEELDIKRSQAKSRKKDGTNKS